MSDGSGIAIGQAVEDFRRLRRRAETERLLAGATGGSVDLLNFEEVRRKLRATAISERQLREIPLDSIVGSVGRYQDFSRSFLPRNDSDRERWARVMVATQNMAGLPPIEVYQIGEVYFVVDGNHRVSVARENGATTIQAYVIPFRSRVTLTPDTQPRDLVIRAEQAEFLEQTRLDETRPGAALEFTEAGQYRVLREHIDVHRYHMQQERGAQVELDEAAAHFYDSVYLPVANLIRIHDLLRDFPERTEADLYLWVAEHRAQLERALGWEISTEQAAADLATRKVTPAKAGEQMLELILPDSLTPPPAAGSWRQGRSAPREVWLFDELLVPISGEPAGWEALEQAINIAHREQARLYGLHVVRDEAQLTSEASQAVRAEFERRCAAARVSGRLALEVGPVARTIRERSRWADLVVLQISYPPGPGPLDRLKSGLHTLIRTSVRPVLTVPQAAKGVERVLLAYDGSRKAEEALVLATYIKARWGISLAVVTVAEGRSSSVEGARIRAKAYLAEHGLQADFLSVSGPPGEAIIAAAEQTGSEVVIMGGHGHGPVSDLLLGSAVEQVLRTRRLPTLICP
jgi:nucleotide-binding universal stress UspA family protein